MKRKVAYIAVCALCVVCRSLNAAGKESPIRPFSLVAREGFGSIGVGDLNTTLHSLNDNARYEFLRENHPEQCVGEIREVPNDYRDWELELQWAAGWGFSIGVAVSGPTRYYDKSFLTYTLAQGLRQTNDDTYESEIRVSAPVKLSLYRSFAIIHGVSVAISGGIGYYQAHATHTRISYEHTPSNGELLSTFFWDVRGKQAGFHFGGILEFRLNDRFSMMAEGQWRLAKIESLEGISQATGKVFDEYGNLVSSGAASDEGPLYHYWGEHPLLLVEVEKLQVSSLEPPWTGIDFPSDIRGAFMDLGGFSFRIGLRIGLF